MNCYQYKISIELIKFTAYELGCPIDDEEAESILEDFLNRA